MAREVINVGAAPNDGQGDPIRTSFIKTNNNFGELYARAQENPPGSLIGSVGDQAGMYAYDSHFFYYCYADYDGSSIIWAEIPNTVIDAIEIVNGTSNVSIPTANGNVLIGVAGTANVAVFAATGATINGDLTVTGNANLSGNIVGDRIINGTTSIEIPTAGGNANVTVAGVSNIAVFATTGVFFTGQISATGNSAAANFNTAGLVSASGNIQGGNLRTAGLITGTGNVTGGNLSTAGLITATGNITGGNIITAANVQGVIVSASGNLLGGNLVIPNGSRIRGDFSSSGPQGRTVFQTSNVSVNAPTTITAVPGENNANTLASGFGARSASDLGNSAIFGVYSYSNQGAVRSLAIGTANVNPITFLFDTTEVARFTTGGNLGIANSAPVDPLAVTGTAYVSGNITGGNIVTAGTVSAALLTVNGTSTFAGNLMPAANITYNIGNAANRWNDIWLANSTIYLGNAQISANATALNMTTPAGGVLSMSGTTGNLITSGTLTGGNITTGGGITATGNITTNGSFIGNGSGITGVVAVGNVGAASQFTNGTTNLNIPVADGNIIGNIGGSVNLFEFSTVGFSAQGNIAGGNVLASGAVTGGNLLTGGTVSASGNITSSGVFVGDGSGLTNVVGNIGSASQLTSGTTELNIPVANGNIVANVGGSTNLFQWSTLGFSAQGNVTSGNLVTAGATTATGNITGGNLLTSGLISAAGNISGANLNLTGNIVNTGSMRLITGGVGAISLAPNAANVLVATSGGVSIVGTASATGNVTGANFITAGVITATGNVSGANFITAGAITATGNVSGGNLSGTNIVGTLTTAAQTNVTSLGTLSTLSVSGNITAGTVSVGAIENTNANGVGNIGTTTTRFNTVFALASSAQYADLAEYYLADQHYPAGTVVAFGGAQELTICDRDHDVTVAGIVSDRPAYEMNAGLVGDHPTALALAGRVPCHVMGPIRRGQMLVAAGEGRARAEANPCMGAVIGKALEDFDGTTGTIEVVVGRI